MYHMLVRKKRMLSIIISCSLSQREVKSKKNLELELEE